MKRARANCVERTQLANRLKLIAQIAQHEADQPLGLAPLIPRFVALVERKHRQPARHRHPRQRGRRDIGQPALSPLRLAPYQIVESQPEHPSDQLELARFAPVAALAQIGGDRFRTLAGGLSLAIDLFAQRRRETFLLLAAHNLARPRLAADDRRQGPPLAMQFLERQYLFIDPARSRRGGRAQHDQVPRLFDRGADFAAQIARCGQFVPVAEDWGQFLRHRAMSGHAADQCLGNDEPLDRLVQPVGVGAVGMAVAEEGPVTMRVVGQAAVGRASRFLAA